jgi:hypothetical protein
MLSNPSRGFIIYLMSASEFRKGDEGLPEVIPFTRSKSYALGPQLLGLHRPLCQLGGCCIHHG